MRKMHVFQVLVLVGIGWVPGFARADLYSAAAAYEKQDFVRSFELYRELAELGQREAQENLAAMYVGGEGVKRDNVLGYAWATIAKESGGGVAVQSIIDQLDAHLTPAARARVAEVQAKFGKAALQERLLPNPYVPGSTVANPCRMRSAANPDDFYPFEAKQQGISGTVVVEATVAPDGHARSARVWYSLPARVFDEAGRRLALRNGYSAPRVNGVAVACTVRFKVRFYVGGPGDGGTADQKKTLAEAREKAVAGDPRAQLLYGLLLELRSDMNTENEMPISWFVKAAQGGNPTAQYLVGMQTLSGAGQGTEKDDSKGLFWLQLAANASQADAQTSLANYLLRKKTDAEALGKAQDLLEKAVSSGHRDGKFFLAALLSTGPDPARRDPKRALDLLDELKNDFDFAPTYFEIRAATQAMLGDFVTAQADQKAALQLARKLGWDLTDAQARLSAYASSKAWTGNLFAY